MSEQQSREDAPGPEGDGPAVVQAVGVEEPRAADDVQRAKAGHEGFELSPCAMENLRAGAGGQRVQSTTRRRRRDEAHLLVAKGSLCIDSHMLESVLSTPRGSSSSPGRERETRGGKGGGEGNDAATRKSPARSRSFRTY